MQDPFQLAELTVRPDLNQIETDEDAFRLEPLVMDLLCVLAERAGNVVSRHELLEQIWKDRFGADASLTRAISLLRKTFRDAGIDDEWIETVPKRGYRLAISPQAAVTATPERDTDQRWRAMRTLGVVAAVVLPLAVAWRFWPAPGEQPPSTTAPRGNTEEIELPEPEQRSIAVLPLANHSDADDAYLTDALHDEILTQLARIGSMKVISRTSVMQFADSKEPASTIAAQLGVRHLVEGSVLRAGDQIRVNVQLIDGKTDDHVWADVFDREFTAEGLFAIQTEIAIAVAETLQAQITPAERSRLNHRPTQNFAAYQAVLLGRQAFLRRTSDHVAALESAIGHFDRALALEPDYADALAGKAAVYAVWAGYVADEPDGRTRTLAIDHAHQALAIDPLLSLPHAVLGLVAESATERFNHIERALALAPSDATAHFWAALNDLVAGYLDRGEERLLRAREFDPTYPIVNQWLAVTADLRGDAELTLAYAEQGVAMGMTSAKGLLSTVRMRTGDFPGAWEYFEAVVPPAEWDAWIEHVRSAGEGAARDATAIRTIIGPRNGNIIPQFRIAVLSAIGAHDPALDLIAQRVPVDITAFAYVWHNDDPQFRADPRFKTMARSLGLPEYWRATKYPPGCKPEGADDFSCVP